MRRQALTGGAHALLSDMRLTHPQFDVRACLRELKRPHLGTKNSRAEDGFMMARLGVQPAVGVTPGAFLPDMRRGARGGGK